MDSGSTSASAERGESKTHARENKEGEKNTRWINEATFDKRGRCSDTSESLLDNGVWVYAPSLRRTYRNLAKMSMKMIERTESGVERAYWCRMAAAKLIIVAQREKK